MYVHNNLPTQPTTFIGRADELATISRLLTDPACRLLNLVGAGGIGKTRLALQVAAEQEPLYPSGVYFVPLQSVATGDLIPSGIASALKIIFYGPEEPRIQLINYLHEKHLLLVLDNFEHLLDATPLLSDILASAPGVKILTTSRERLNLQEEWTLALKGLPFPDDEINEALEKYDAVQLFVQRARQVQSTFSLKENAKAIKTICGQVEGMPLGIELAASWLRLMTCQQIAVYMTASLEFLTASIRNIPERHRSIRAVFDQSWKLLSDREQNVLMKLSVFRGGFDLEAAETIAGASIIILASLADKSLIQLNSAGCYDLHELLRQYAAERLAESGETINTADQHLTYFTMLAEAGEAHAYGREQVIWYDRQEAMMDNLRAALAYSLSKGDIELGLRMAAALRWVWEIRGYVYEGVSWFEKLLSAADGISVLVHAKALHRACEVAGGLMEHKSQAKIWAEEALKLANSVNDKWNIAWSLSAGAYFINDYQNLDQPAAMLEESLALFRRLDDPLGMSHVLRRRAVIAIYQANYLCAQILLEEALIDARKVADKNATAWALHLQACLLWRLHQQVEQVIPLYEESISLFREIGDIAAVAYPLVDLAYMERSRRNYERSRALFEKTLLLLRGRGINSTDPSISAMAGIGNLEMAQGEFDRAAKLMGAVDKLAHEMNHVAVYFHRDDTALVRTQLGDEAFEKAWAEGKALSIDQAVAYALGEMLLSDEPHQSSNPQPLTEPLTERELEVLRLMGQGLSNPQIAQQLIVATGTIKAHTNSIFGKLNVSNRVQAVNRAKELHLL